MTMHQLIKPIYSKQINQRIKYWVSVFNKSIFLLVIPLSLSAFTHLWNPIGFPIFHIDEGYYMERAMDVLKGLGPLDYVKILGYYDHPFFGQLLMGAIFGLFNYPDFFLPASNGNMIQTVEMSWLFPRLVMGILAVFDTFLIYVIAETRYNKRIALMASVFFAVMPMTWLFRSIWLDNILIPFLLMSILFALKISVKKQDMNTIIKKNIFKMSNNVGLVVLSGIFLGLAIFTKETAFIMIPLVGATICQKKLNLKLLAIWFIPVIFIPFMWPMSALLEGDFEKWLEVFSHQTHRMSKPLIESISALFKVDPLIASLGFTGLIFAAIRKDILILLWVVPFFLFEYSIGFVSLFHFNLIIPAFCLSSATLISDLSNKIIKIINLTNIRYFQTILIDSKFNKYLRSPFSHNQHSLELVVTSVIAIFGLICTTMLITLNLNAHYIEADATVINYLPNKDNTTGAKKIVTVLSRASDFIWIPKYILDKDQHDYQSYFWNKPIKTGMNLLVIDDGFRNTMLKSNEVGRKLEALYNSTTSIQNFTRSSEYYNLYKYPYNSITDRQILNSLGIASGTKPGKIEIKTNY